MVEPPIPNIIGVLNLETMLNMSISFKEQACISIADSLSCMDSKKYKHPESSASMITSNPIS